MRSSLLICLALLSAPALALDNTPESSCKGAMGPAFSNCRRHQQSETGYSFTNCDPFDASAPDSRSVEFSVMSVMGETPSLVCADISNNTYIDENFKKHPGVMNLNKTYTTSSGTTIVIDEHRGKAITDSHHNTLKSGADGRWYIEGQDVTGIFSDQANLTAFIEGNFNMLEFSDGRWPAPKASSAPTAAETQPVGVDQMSTIQR